jgi:hypothetical protein
MESELVVLGGLVLRLQRDSNIVKGFLAVIQNFTPTALFQSQHTLVLCLVLLLLVFAEFLEHKGEHY